MLRCFPRSLPRLICDFPMVEELPGHEIDGEHTKDQDGLEEEPTDQGEGEPGENGTCGLDHEVTAPRSPEHAIRNEQRRAEGGQHRHECSVHECLAEAEPSAALLVLAVVAPKADGEEGSEEAAPVHFPVGHGLSLLGNSAAELAPHGARVGAL